jgi:phosphate transport system protein
MREHTDREYEAELQKLRDQILYMGAKVEEMIASSMRALVERDSDLARRTIELDHQVNRLEIDTDGLCLAVLARRQPVASDLRFITSALKLVTDLERIGDLGVNICERVLELNDEPPLKPYIDLPRMADEAQGMVKDALDAFVKGDAGRAQDTIERDAIVDAYYAQVFRDGGPADDLPRHEGSVDREVPRTHRRPRHQPGRDGDLHGAAAGYPTPGEAHVSRR